jgi:hypothetical protein
MEASDLFARLAKEAEKRDQDISNRLSEIEGKTYANREAMKEAAKVLLQNLD